MDLNKQNRMHDLNQMPDKTQYKVLFYIRRDNNLELYETLNLNSSPQLPSEGDYISFDFIVDKNENEVFRKDGFIPESEIGSDRAYKNLTSPDFKIDNIKTNYNKHVTKKDKYVTTITKIVTLTSPADNAFAD